MYIMYVDVVLQFVGVPAIHVTRQLPVVLSVWLPYM